MGNKLCKEKNDVGPSPVKDNTKCEQSRDTFGKIFSRLRLKPTSWKSESHLNQKQVTRNEVKPTKPQSDSTDNIVKSQQLSKSSDWTDVSLEVPDEHIHLRNPKLSLIFNDNTTPTPPPRKHKKNFREKIESVAKSGLQAFQINKNNNKPVEEPLVVKKTINYKCPLCDSDEKNHNRDHHHHNINNNNNKKVDIKSDKRRKNLSVISLPNYNELKLTVANFEEIDKPNNRRPSSTASLNSSPKKLSVSSTGKLDSYITRCRSFGSLLPQQLKKLKVQKTPTDVESDDSFGGLEDWDLGLIEHYNPKDASLPRPIKPKQKIRNDNEILSGIESLIVNDDINNTKPVVPERKSETLLKKINKENSQTSHKLANNDELRNMTKSVTPPPSPENESNKIIIDENEPLEHSTLLKILQDFSVKDIKSSSIENETPPLIVDEISKENSAQSSLSPSLKEFERNLGNTAQLEDFINAEKMNTHVNSVGKYNSPLVS